MDDTIKITVGGEPDDEHGSRWLRDDEDVAVVLRPTMVPDDRAPTGAMGGAEVIEAIVANGLAAASLLVSYLQWKQARRSRRKATLEVRRGDLTWTFTGSPAEAQKFAREITPMTDDRPAA